MRLEHRGTGVHFSAVLPTFTNTELISGMHAPSGIVAQPEDVAAAIARLIARPRSRVSVTRLAGVLAAFNKLTPRPIGEYFARRLGMDHTFTDEIDRTARADYNRRLGSH